MAKQKTVYLDHAATSYPKPPAVAAAMVDCMKHRGGNPGRGSHRLALEAAREIYHTREIASAFFHADPARVIFTLNTTHALNMAIKGIMGGGGHAICSDMEHNSVYRPLYRLAADGVITFDVFDTFPTAQVRTDDRILASLASRVRPNTRMVVCAHASNLCGAMLPLERIGAFCRRRGILFVVDGAQSAGVWDIDMERMHIDALCVPGHKALLGPQGVGMLILGEGVRLDTLMEGGNGMDSLAGTMSEDAPERYEPGTLQTPAIAGLAAGMEYLQAIGLDAIRAHETRLARRMIEGLSSLPHVRVFAPGLAGSAVLFTVEGLSSEAVGLALDTAGICVRPGFHCSALGHRTLGTPSEGAVRASVGYSTTEREVEVFLREVEGLVRG